MNDGPKLSAASMSAKYNSKRDIYYFLTVDVAAYLPCLECVTIYFLRDIISGKKKWVSSLFTNCILGTSNVVRFHTFLFLNTIIWRSKKSGTLSTIICLSWTISQKPKRWRNFLNSSLSIYWHQLLVMSLDNGFAKESKLETKRSLQKRISTSILILLSLTSSTKAPIIPSIKELEPTFSRLEPKGEWIFLEPHYFILFFHLVCII